MKIGDKIRDVEDGDCYYEGVVVQLDPLKYKITNVLWNNEFETEHNGTVIELKWWYVEVLKDNAWIQLDK